MKSAALFLLSLLYIPSISAQQMAATHDGFEFRGIRTGMHKKDVEVALGVQIYCHNLDALVDADNQVPTKGAGWRCLDGHSPVVVMLNGMGKVWNVRYDFLKDNVSESPASFAAAFTAKYGKPKTATKTYRNGLGNEFSGLEYTWQRGTQELRVDEFCGSVDNGCLAITDVAYGPKLPLPQI